METRPVQRLQIRQLKQVGPPLLLSLAALFMIGGTVSLYLTRPSLTLWHLGALAGGWAVAWGGSAFLLRSRLPEADPFILPIVALLTGWGLLLLARLAPAFMLRQVLWLLVGCSAMCAVALIPILPRLLRRYRYSLLAGGLLLLGTTLIFGVNPSGFGQQLWLGAFGVYFQPSEPLKLLLVIYLSAYLCDRRDILTQKNSSHSQWFIVLGPMLVMVGLALLLLGWQQDLGAALLFYLTFIAILYLTWGKVSYVALGLLLFAPVVIVGYYLSSRVALRVSIWLNPWDPQQADRAFQILQSLFALASGGLFGQGLGQGFPTLIPAVHTDFVYAALVEEFGTAGMVGLLALVGLLVYRGILLAQDATAPFESLLAGGIAAVLGIQTWVIVGGNAKLIPITGVTLPFLSYGGSSLLTMLVTMGLLLNLSAPHPPPLTLSLAPQTAPSLRKTSGNLGRVILLLLGTTAFSTGHWTILKAETLQTYPTNPRWILAESRIQRGRILDHKGQVLAGIQTDEAGYVTRTYPVPEAAPVVGYATLQYGTAGIEAACDARLRGDIRRTNWDIFRDQLLHRDPVGEDVRLTIDARLQETAQHLLKEHIGAAVLVDARTGEILALASSPIYDPANVETSWETLRDSATSPLLNRVTQSLAQPGAILETVILGIAADGAESLPPLRAPLQAPVPINGTQITCNAPPEGESWRAAMTATCPAPFAALGEQLSSQQLAQGLTHWGLTDAPNLEIPTVAAPPWEAQALNTTQEALGQGDLLVTPLQMVGVAATLANDGERPNFHLLTKAVPGCPPPPNTPPIRVIQPKLAEALRETWPSHGEAIGHVATALAGPERIQTWFIGLNSPDVPRYAVAVMLDNAERPAYAATIGVQLLENAVHPSQP